MGEDSKRIVPQTSTKNVPQPQNLVTRSLLRDRTISMTPPPLPPPSPPLEMNTAQAF